MSQHQETIKKPCDLKSSWKLQSNHNILMFGITLDSHRPRDPSISSVSDQESDPIRLCAIIEEQKKIIRRLNMKLSKVQEALKRERDADRVSRSSIDSPKPQDLHFQMLRAQIEKAGLLQKSLHLLTSKIDHLAASIMLEMDVQDSNVQQEDGLGAQASLFQSNNPQVQDTKEQNQKMLFNIQRTFFQLGRLEKTMRQLKEKLSIFRNENKNLQVDLKKSMELQKKGSFDSQELKEIKNQYENERKYCHKLKKLLEKSQHERNQLLAKIDESFFSQTAGSAKSSQDWISLSKSLAFKVKTLEKEKRQILKENIKEKQNWSKQYKEFLSIVKYLRKNQKNDKKQ